LIKRMPEGIAQVVFEIKTENKRPTVSNLAYPFYVPHKKDENKCHSIASLMDATPMKYKVGQSVKEKITRQVSKFKIFKDDDPKEAAGFAIIALKGEGFKYRCTKEGDFKDLIVGKDKAMILGKTCCIKVEPKDDKMWGVNDVEFHAHGFDGNDNSIAGPGSEIAIEKIKESTSFSEGKMVAKILRENCDGELGWKCPERKCPGGQIERK
jgi:hypothetical protein